MAKTVEAAVEYPTAMQRRMGLCRRAIQEVASIRPGGLVAGVDFKPLSAAEREEIAWHGPDVDGME